MNRMVTARLGIAACGILVQVLAITIKLSLGRADPVYDSWILMGAGFTCIVLLSIVWKLHKMDDRRSPSGPRHLTITPSPNK